MRCESHERLGLFSVSSLVAKYMEMFAVGWVRLKPRDKTLSHNNILLIPLVVPILARLLRLVFALTFY